jgi:hypothetical protein
MYFPKLMYEYCRYLEKVHIFVWGLVSGLCMRIPRQDCFIYKVGPWKVIQIWEIWCTTPDGLTEILSNSELTQQMYWRQRSDAQHLTGLLKFSVIFFLICIVGGWSPNWVHSARQPFTGLLYLPQVIVRMENSVEWMAGGTKVLRENVPWRHFVHHKSHLTRPEIEPGPPRWEASD